MYVRGYWQGSENGRVVTIGVFVVYIDTGSSMLIILSKSRDLADENNIFFDGMEMIRNNRIILCRGKVRINQKGNQKPWFEEQTLQWT